VTLSLEGLAVLAGVLLAFSVESYGQARDDQERAARMLVALDAELDVNAGRLSSRIEADDEELNVIDSLFVAVVLPAEGVTPSVDAVTGAIERIGPKVVQPFQTGALDDLLLSGGLTLVDDQQVRQGILEYSRMLTYETAAQENGVDFWNDHLSPYYFEYGNLGHFLAADRLDLDAPPPVSGAFVRSRKFANLLGERRAIVNRLREARVSLRTQVDSLRQLLR
jgi:hypothetical protein